jgi:hypothetical protein
MPLASIETHEFSLGAIGIIERKLFAQFSSFEREAKGTHLSAAILEDSVTLPSWYSFSLLPIYPRNISSDLLETAT